MTDAPASGYLSDSARTTAQMKQALEDFLAFLRQQPGASGAAEPTYTLSSDAITALVGIFSVDTESAASTDNLANIVQTNLPEPAIVYLRAANASHVVTVKHSAGGGGQISLRNGVDFVLRTTSTWLVLKRTGTTWQEIGRFYNGQPVNDGAEVDVASATTTSIGTQTSSKVRITGTTTITGLGTADSGVTIDGRFAGILTLTHNGTSLICPTAANITTAAGDSFRAESLGSGNWKILNYQRSDGTALSSSSSELINPQTGTTYTYVSGDNGKLVTHSNASAIAGTLPQATGSFAAGWWMDVANIGAGTLTITPTTSTINGAATLVLTTGQGCRIISDGTNYQIAGIPDAVTKTGTQTLTNKTLTSPKLTGSLFAGLPQIGNITADTTYVPIVGVNLATGDRDLYTVPAGKKALIIANGRNYNPSAGTINSFSQIKVSGTYYRISGTTNNPSGTGSNAGIGQAIVLNAGESFSLNVATTSGLNYRGAAIEFDSAETRIATARILALASGDNLLFTVPANKTALGITTSPVGFNGLVQVLNASGGSLNYYVNQVPSGGSVGSTNQLYPATAVADISLGQFTIGESLATGEFISVNSSGAGAGQVAWMTYYLIP